MFMSKIACKGLALLFIGLFLNLGLIAGASAQFDPFENQPPMTNSEAKKFLKAIDEMNKADDDSEKIMAIIEDSGMDQMRFAYVMTKFTAAMTIINEGQTAAATIPPTAMPTDEEMAIAKGHVDAFNKIIAESDK